MSPYSFTLELAYLLNSENKGHKNGTVHESV
jgi:hypothetical protein